MELTLHRIEKTSEATIGKLYLEDRFICDTLEDRDRGLKQEWELATILAKKIPGETAIPTGRYEIEITYSNRFERPLPLLVNVPGFEGVRIHSANKASQLQGCIAPGVRHENESIMEVQRSRITFSKVYKLIGEALLNERVYITIQ